MSTFEKRTVQWLVLRFDRLDRWKRNFVRGLLARWDDRLTEAQMLKLREIAIQHLPPDYLHHEPADPSPKHRGRSGTVAPEIERIMELQRERSSYA